MFFILCHFIQSFKFETYKDHSPKTYDQDESVALFSILPHDKVEIRKGSSRYRTSNARSMKTYIYFPKTGFVRFETSSNLVGLGCTVPKNAVKNVFLSNKNDFSLNWKSSELGSGASGVLILHSPPSEADYVVHITLDQSVRYQFYPGSNESITGEKQSFNNVSGFALYLDLSLCQISNCATVNIQSSSSGTPTTLINKWVNLEEDGLSTGVLVAIILSSVFGFLIILFFIIACSLNLCGMGGCCGLCNCCRGDPCKNVHNGKVRYHNDCNCCQCCQCCSCCSCCNSSRVSFENSPIEDGVINSDYSKV